jgi:catechol 2,3-dioxygenase-like lactoylglutathione lyase family enzyme
MRISHFGISVPNAAAAETYYCALFDMEVYVREIRWGNNWKSLDHSIAPTRAAELGFNVGMVVLRHGDFALSVQEVDAHKPTLLEHVAVIVEPPDFQLVRERAERCRCRMLKDKPHRFVFVDHYGMVWEIIDGDFLLTARDMGYGWIDADGTIHPGESKRAEP